MTREELRELRTNILEGLRAIESKVGTPSHYWEGYKLALGRATGEVKACFAECEKSMFPEESTK